MNKKMSKKLSEVQDTVERVQKEYPKQTGDFMKFLRSAEGSGALDTKTKELMSVALSVACKCEWCIAFHVKNALEAGASRKEVMESCFVAVAMNGGPALMYMKPVMDALDEFEKT